MTVRTGMANVIANLRLDAQAGTADFSIGYTAYWSDNQLQGILDEHRLDFSHEALTPETDYSGGTIIYKRYYLPHRNLESGTALTIENSAGVAVGTALYTVDYNANVVTFANDTGGSAYYASGRSFDRNRAAADVWSAKAAYYSTKPDFSTDNHSVKYSKVAEMCLAMATKYEALAGPTVISVYRSDNYGGR